MRIAFFSPMPPTRSGIADYSEALLQSLQRLAGVQVFTEFSEDFVPETFEGILYQIGYNGYH
ncbi:MAG TPA: hypothetical protein VES20_22705, partial [Bryobacteraceae bacterium]|nr:hypothetical protein [Bryobacteraceae bacterium]